MKRDNGTGKNYGLTLDTIRADWPLLLLALGSLIIALILYPQLPDRVPSHWNIRGEVDSYLPKFWGVLGVPVLSIWGTYLFMLLAPLVDPKRENYARFGGAYRLLRGGIVSFLVALHVIVLAAALGHDVRVGTLVQVGVSLLIALIGNVMGQVRHNYFVGIRTPWTLASEEVWRRTHRASARVWVAAGLAGLAGALAGPVAGFWILMTALGGAALFSVVYSLVLYRRLHP